MRAARRQMTLAQRAEASRAICARLENLLAELPTKLLAAYWPRWDEADISKFVLNSARSSRSVYLPRFVAQGAPLAMHKIPLSTWQMTTGYGGILEPGIEMPSIAPEKIPVAIVPATSADRSGNRIGSGRGHYDITFSAMPNLVLICPIYSCQLASRLPSEPHDIPVNVLVTEHETIRMEA